MAFLFKFIIQFLISYFFQRQCFNIVEKKNDYYYDDDDLRLVQRISFCLLFIPYLNVSWSIGLVIFYIVKFFDVKSFYSYSFTKKKEEERNKW